MNFKLTRTKLGLTLAQIKELTGLSFTTLCKIEKGNIDNVKLGTLKKLAIAMNSDVQTLFLSNEN